MTQITLNIQDDKFDAFKKYIDTLSYVEIENSDVLLQNKINKEMIARVEESEADYKRGKVMSQEELEDLSNKW